MALAIFSRSSRLRPNTKAKKKINDKDDGDAATAKRPDVEELRKRRLAYHTAPVDQRRSVSSGVNPKTKARPRSSLATASSSQFTPTEPGRRKHRRHEGKSNKNERKERKAEDESGDRVYTAAGVQQDLPRDTHIGSRRSRRGHVLPKQPFTNITEEEVTPDDSISQVGTAAPVSTVSIARTPSKSPARNASTTRLPPIREGSGTAKISNISSRNSLARQSSIFGSFMQRKPSQSIPPPPRLVECLTCGSDDVSSSKTAKLACGHRMCHDCLKRIFEMSVKDPAHMPPKCCTRHPIPLRHVEKLFDLKFKVLWNRKYEEYKTKNRVYCPALKCGEWIKPSQIHTYKGRKFAQCPRCKLRVCTSCNSKMHKSSDCPKDPAIVKLVEQAKEKGWQSCYNCHAMIELKEGCNHMTCRCTAEFCMICGSKWKTCECPWFNYRNLPDPDRLTEMRVPEPIQIMVRRVFNAAGMPTPNMQGAEPPGEHRRQAQRAPTYNEELDQRRQQERLDADLARRMQLASLLDSDEDERPSDRRRNAEVEAWGLGNEAGHFMNDDFVNNAANVVMSAFGDASMGRRGERASGRRRRARAQQLEDNGLAPNFLGDESVLNVRQARRR